MIRDHHLRLRIQGDRPITVSEVAEFLPAVHRLQPDPSPRSGLFALDRDGTGIGYVVRTIPQARHITGYSGPTDGLVVFDGDERVVGVAIRHSYDTPSHVSDVVKDYLFMENWNGRSWEEVAAIDDLGDARIYAVSGASRTSEALAWSITERLRHGADEAAATGGLDLRWRWQDFALIGIFAGGCLMAFIKNRRVQRWRPWFAVAVFAILGFVLGDLIAQSLLIGWAQSRIPWEQTPGLVIFVAACFVVPWFSRQPVYCQFLCPHGHAQRWLMKLTPASWQWKLSDDVKRGLRALPVLLLALVLVVSFVDLPFDLAGIEPFDAYLLSGAGLATIVVAIVGLVLAAFVPMAYCKYGCPTGLLFIFLRRRSGHDRPGVRDAVALAFVLAALALRHFHPELQTWLFDA